MTNISEFTSIFVLLMCESSVNGKKPENCCLCEQRICVFNGKVIPVILRLFTGIRPTVY